MDHKSQEMIEKLKGCGITHGYAVLQTVAVIVGPGEPFNVCPTWFVKADLQKAIDAGLLEKRKLSGSSELDIYAIRLS